MRLVLLFLFSALSLGGLAQRSLSNIGARSWGMGHAMVALPQDQSFFSNPAGLGFTKGAFVNTSFDSRFNVSGLSTVSMSAAHSTEKLAVSIGAERFGDKLYNENKAGIALAKKAGFVSLGIKASFLGTYAENISSANSLLTEFGVMAKLHKLFILGFHASNITGAKLLGTQKLPTVLSLGGSFYPAEQVIITAETEYSPNQNAFFKGGLEYRIQERLFLRTGINTAFKTNHFGLGYLYEKWQVDYAVNTHPTLGFSHHISLNMALRK